MVPYRFRGFARGSGAGRFSPRTRFLVSSIVRSAVGPAPRRGGRRARRTPVGYGRDAWTIVAWCLMGLALLSASPPLGILGIALLVGRRLFRGDRAARKVTSQRETGSPLQASGSPAPLRPCVECRGLGWRVKFVDDPDRRPFLAEVRQLCQTCEGRKVT